MNLTSPTDTLVCDTAQLARWQSDPVYNYNRELIAPEINLFEWINKQFGEFLREIFGSRFADEWKFGNRNVIYNAAIFQSFCNYHSYGVLLS